LQPYRLNLEGRAIVSTTEAQLISSGGVASRFGVSREAVKTWERAGVIVPALRVEGSNRRVWQASDLPILEAQISARMNAAGRVPAAVNRT
jgi:hypothetical protein